MTEKCVSAQWLDAWGCGLGAWVHGVAASLQRDTARHGGGIKGQRSQAMACVVRGERKGRL